MKIALDYDDTFTRDPFLWQMFIETAILRGHSVYIVTWRTFEECADIDSDTIKNIVVLPTFRQAKKEFCKKEYGIDFDIWIDDNPAAILYSMIPSTT